MTRGWALRMTTALAAGVLLAGAGRAAPDPDPAAPPGFVWYVLNQLNAFSLDVEDPTNRPPLVTEVPDGVLTAVEINGDGKADWLVRWPESAQFCGTGGCETSLYISDGEGFVRALDRQALSFEIRTVDGERRIEAGLHHLNCAQGQADCLRAWAWDPAAGRLQERPSSDGISRMSLTAAVDLGEEPDGTPRLPDWTPPILMEMRAAGRRWCPAANAPDGHALRQPLVHDSPDVNGDGLRDWVFTPEADCDRPPETGFQVWVSTAPGPGPHGEDGAVSLAYTAPLDRWAEYDVSTRPATLRVVAPCQDGTDCAGIPLRWEPRTGCLVE